MRTIIFAGAGQMGKMALRMLNRRHYQMLGFADNDPALQGVIICDLPVFSISEAVKMTPDVILIAVSGQERTALLQSQLRKAGFRGKVRTLAAYLEALDIRGAALTLLAERIRKIPGDLAELGVYQGDFAKQLNALFPERDLYLFDTFTGFDERDIAAEAAGSYSRVKTRDFDDTSLETVLAKMPAPKRVIPRKGYFPETAEGLHVRFALVSLDADLYEPTLAGLCWFYPRLVSGGIILLHDYHNTRFAGVRAAVDTFEKEHGRLLLLPICDAHGTMMAVHP